MKVICKNAGLHDLCKGCGASQPHEKASCEPCPVDDTAICVPHDTFLDKLQFNHNWNGKLDCHCFTTLRMRNDRKYFEGNCFDIWLKNESKGQAKIVGVKYLLLDQINNWIARLDTGYDAEKCKNLIRTMYKNKGIDWSKQQLAYVMLEKYEPNPRPFQELQKV